MRTLYRRIPLCPKKPYICYRGINYTPVSIEFYVQGDIISQTLLIQGYNCLPCSWYRGPDNWAKITNLEFEAHKNIHENIFLATDRVRIYKYMLTDVTRREFWYMSQLVQLRGKDTVQCAHCAVESTDQTCNGHSQGLWGCLAKTSTTAGCNISLDLLDLLPVCNCRKLNEKMFYGKYRHIWRYD